MANYSLVLDTKFNPFSYSEMLAPVAAATQAHLAVEEEFGNLAAKADVWDNMANELTDPQAYRMYKGYSNDLKARAEDLMRNGLNASSRKGMLDMRARYSKEIVPIEAAYKRREELSAELRKALMNDPTLRYLRMANTMSLDDFIINPAADYGLSYSGSLLTKLVSEAVSNLKRVLTTKEGLRSAGLPYLYERMLRKGAQPEEVLKAMLKASLNDPEVAIFLRGITDLVLKSSGVAKWANPTTMEEFRSFANQGLYSALGETSFNKFTDSYSMLNPLEANKYTREHGSNSTLNPKPLRARQLIEEANLNIQRYIQEGYFEMGPNGHYVMTKKGLKAYLEPDLSEEQMAKLASYNRTPYALSVDGTNIFRKAMDELGASNYVITNSKGETVVLPGNMGNVFHKYIDANKETSYDTYHSTEYSSALKPEYGKAYKKAIVANATTKDGKKVIQAVEFAGKEGFKVVKDLSVEDIEDYDVIEKNESKWGATAILYKDGAEPIRVRIPSINSTADYNVGVSIADADDYGMILDNNRKPRYTVTSSGEIKLQRDRKGNILYTDEELAPEDYILFKKKQREALNDMSFYGSLRVVESETKPELWKPIGI